MFAKLSLSFAIFTSTSDKLIWTNPIHFPGVEGEEIEETENIIQGKGQNYVMIELFLGMEKSGACVELVACGRGGKALDMGLSGGSEVSGSIPAWGEKVS